MAQDTTRDAIDYPDVQANHERAVTQRLRELRLAETAAYVTMFHNRTEATCRAYRNAHGERLGCFNDALRTFGNRAWDMDREAQFANMTANP